MQAPAQAVQMWRERRVSPIPHNPRAERMMRGLSLRDVSRRMGISRSYLYALEQGQRSWTPTIEKKWRAAL
jgi:transcriptional regulator with XRE-family HTH domain